MKKKVALWVSGKYIKKNWRAAGLEPTTSAHSRTIVVVVVVVVVLLETQQAVMA